MKYTQIVTALAMIFIVSSCATDPLPCFKHDAGELNDINVSFTFNGDVCSFHANKFDWDWGDGSPIESGQERSHSWNAPGWYKVTMTASNNSGKSGQIANNIVIGDRNVQLIDINTIPADNGGTPWDASDEPDLVVALTAASSGTTWLLETSENTDLAIPVPYSVDMSTSGLILTDEDWTWELRDMDGATYEVMATGTVNPITDGSDFIIQLTATDTDIQIRYGLQNPPL